MPPRKSDIAKTVTGDEATPVKETTVVREGMSIEDLNLPKSIVTRLAKGVLPPNTQIQGNAMLAMSKSATVFVNYLATHANENAQHRSVKTIAPQDVFKALDDLEFPDFKPRLEAELAKFIELQSDKKSTYRKKVADKATGGQSGVDDGEGDSEMVDREGDGEPKAKKVRRDGGSDERQEEHDEEEAEADADEDHEDDEEGEDEEGEGEGENGGEAGEEDDEEEKLEFEDPEDEALDNGEDSD